MIFKYSITETEKVFHIEYVKNIDQGAFKGIFEILKYILQSYGISLITLEDRTSVNWDIWGSYGFSGQYLQIDLRYLIIDKNLSSDTCDYLILNSDTKFTGYIKR
ncbi:hypothetical protein D3C79_919070 [compost metagenome]